MSQNALSSNVQAAIDSAVGSKAVDVYAYLEGTKKPVIEVVAKDLNLNESTASDVAVAKQSESVIAPAAIDLQDAINSAVDNVVGSPAVNVYAYLDKANSTESKNDIVQEIAKIVPEVVPATVDETKEEAIEAKSSLVDEINQSVPEAEAAAVDETKEEAIEAKSDVVEEIKQVVPEVTPVPIVAESKPASVDLAAAVNYAVSSVVGSPAVDVYTYLEKTNKPTLVERVEQGVEKVKEEVTEVKNEAVKEIKEKSREIESTTESQTEPEQPAVEAKEELVEEIKHVVPEVAPAAVDETKEEAVEAKEDVLEEIKDVVPEVAPVTDETKEKTVESEEEVAEAKEDVIEEIKDVVPEVAPAAVDETKEEAIEAKEDVLEEIKDVVPEVAPAVVATKPLQIDLQSAIDYAIKSVVGYSAVDVYAHLESANPSVKKETTPITAVQNLGAQAQQLSETVRSAVIDNDEQAASVADVKADAFNLAESAKVAAVATASAATVGVASLLSSKSNLNEENDVKRDIETTETETKPYVAQVVQNAKDTAFENATAAKTSVDATIEEAKEQAPVIQKSIDTKVESAKASVAATIEEAKEQAPVIQKDIDNKVESAKAAVGSTIEEAKEQAPVIQKSIDDKVESVKTSAADSADLAQEKIAEIQKEIPVVQEQIKSTMGDVQKKLSAASVQKPEPAVPVPVAASQVNPETPATPIVPVTAVPVSKPVVPAAEPEHKPLPSKPAAEEKGSKCTIM